ncbi:MAG: gcrA cell cycle regulator family protein [Proteobacteria bacterium]|jgi:GcrA cell cycle regulator|nr:GcrA family cell cycle regulator [Alphaproteobacteria bacterium]NCC02526.1 gcrA cell cycle regulator family protein [Pseudomonadota bacterium]
MAWTEQQIQTLKKMWGNGYSASEIAKSLGGGVTRNAVIGKAHRLKLSAGASAPRSAVTPPSKTSGVVMTTIKKVSKRHDALRTLPPAQPIDTTLPPRAKARSLDALLRPIDVAKRSEGIPVTKAGERHCRWPIGDPRSPDFRFCGCEVHEGLPYCVEHARVAYQTVSRKSRANANMDSVVMNFQTKKPN